MISLDLTDCRLRETCANICTLLFLRQIYCIQFKWNLSAPEWTNKEIEGDIENLVELRNRTNDWGYLLRVTVYMFKFIEAIKFKDSNNNKKKDFQSVKSVLL